MYHQTQFHSCIFVTSKKLTFLFFLFFRFFIFFCFMYSIGCTIGKSFLLRAIANAAMDLGLNVCISAPTGKLASIYTQQFPSCQCNTVQSNYFVPVDNTKQTNTINWSLANVHALLVDKVHFRLSHALLPAFQFLIIVSLTL